MAAIPFTRLVYAADLHGDAARYAELHDLVRAVRPAALVLGGDLIAHAREPQAQVAYARGALRAFVAAVPVPVFAIPGNDDWAEAYQAAREACGGALRPLSLQPQPVTPDVTLIGYPCVPPTPFRLKDFERRDRAADVTAPGVPPSLPSIEEDLAQLGEAHSAAVWVFHTPPHGGALDVTNAGQHVGSRALRAAIERLQPPIALHGHIHEAPDRTGRWVEPIGRTLCVNPGRGFGRLDAVVVELDGPEQEAPGPRVLSMRHTARGAVERTPR